MLASPKLQAVRNVINTVARSRPSSPTSPSRSSSPARFSTFEPSKTNVLLVSSSDTACMQRIRTRLAKDLGVNIAVELASSTPALDTAVSIHKPNLVFCMDDRAVRLMPPAVLTSDAVPCLTFTQPVGEAGQLLVQQPNAPMNTQSRVITGKVWESRPVGTPSPNSTRGSHHRTVLASTVSQTVVDIVRKRAAGMTVQGAAGEGRLIAYDDPTLASRLGDVDFGFSAEDVAARIQAADSAPGTRHSLCGLDVLMYGAHVECGGDPVLTSLSGKCAPGSVIALRDGAIAIQCGKGVVWVSHLKLTGASAARSPHKPFKLPSTMVLPPGILRTIPALPSLPLLPTPLEQLGTFRDVWGTVNGPVANVHFPFYNGVMTVGQGRRLKNCVSALTSRPDVKVVTLHGDGCESFSFGLDWNTVQGAVNPFGAGWEAMNASNDVIREILTAQDKIVVSAMAGDASAGGAMLAAACDLVWTHGDAILNPHYKSMGISGSDYWTYTLPRRVGPARARDMTSSLAPLSALTAMEDGLVDAVLSEGNQDFLLALQDNTHNLLCDEARMQELLAAKAAANSKDGLEAMHRARMYESVVMRDNLREAGHIASRKMLVEKGVPLSTPLHLPGQAAAFGRVLDGKQLASLKMKDMKASVDRMKEALHVAPKLAVVLVGDRPDSKKYVQHKMKACKDVGIESHTEVVPLPPTDCVADGSVDTRLTEALIDRVRSLNNDDSVHGIIVQLPLPAYVDTQRVLAEISPCKDVDGFGAEHLGALAGGVSKSSSPSSSASSPSSSSSSPKPFVPCTAGGIMALLDHYSIPVSGKQVVIVGRSAIVGMPAQLLFMKRNATVNACDIHTPDLASRVNQADIVIVAAGSARLVKGDWIKPGAVVVDVGINFDKTGKMVGDVEFDAAVRRSSYITPVPGGIGPMTVAMLMENTVQAFAQQTAGRPLPAGM